MRNSLLPLIISCLILAGLIGCDVTGEQNFDVRPGDSLAIVGPSEVIVPDTVEYYLQAFTIEKEYTWTVNGSEPYQVRRDGEFIDVIMNSEGTYTIEVTGPEYSGTLEVTADDTTNNP